MPPLGALFPKSNQSSDRMHYDRLWLETLGRRRFDRHVPSGYDSSHPCLRFTRRRARPRRRILPHALTQTHIHASRAAKVSRQSLVRPAIRRRSEFRTSLHTFLGFVVRSTNPPARPPRHDARRARARASTPLSTRRRVRGADPTGRADPHGGLAPRRRFLWGECWSGKPVHGTSHGE